MSPEKRLIEKLQRIERLAAELARERILARQHQAEKQDPAVEYKVSWSDQCSLRLLIALFRRYGVKPYRYQGERRMTMWPEFEALQATLQDYFELHFTRSGFLKQERCSQTAYRADVLNELIWEEVAAFLSTAGRY
jgi:hypothetical protein